MVFGIRRRMMKLAATLALALAAPFAQGATGLDNNLDQRLLASHNRERATIGIRPLKWDDRLASDAALYVRHLIRVGHLVHSENDPGDPDPQGENLWAGGLPYTERI